MSLEAVLGRIDQILALQQQVQNPVNLATGASSASASGGAGAAPSTGSTTGTSAVASTDFASALASAQATTDSAITGMDSTDTTDTTDPLLASLSSSSMSPLTLSQLTSALGSTGGLTSTAGASATSSSDPRIEAMVNEASSLIGKPYVWGGGHSGWGPQSGYDCSGFVSAVLHAGGYLSSPQDTETLPSQPGIESGPGQYVTIYDRTTPGTQGHTIIDINGQFYESGGEAGAWGGGGGVEAISTPSAAYLSTFNLILHPEGL